MNTIYLIYFPLSPIKYIAGKYNLSFLFCFVYHEVHSDDWAIRLF